MDKRKLGSVLEASMVKELVRELVKLDSWLGWEKVLWMASSWGWVLVEWMA